ncbi:SWIB/MDM2 domain-containing protein [Chitinophaga sp.]|uniref:SWIB/MDM2 domain-containing protein n=1 Tax=Chitinophaga sp. TaxID=1869181 RepID=UPI002BD314E3|nr:SWIB/MDM2 domain-containing protein [Chitinophaga sp.]HWV66249.1 SWIB/MDM2 domain-containing protein [Chitinophaga sp.]
MVRVATIQGIPAFYNGITLNVDPRTLAGTGRRLSEKLNKYHLKTKKMATKKTTAGKSKTATTTKTPAKKAATAKKAAPAKATAKKAAPPKKAAPTKKSAAASKASPAKKSAAGASGNSGLKKPLSPSADLAAVIGDKALPRTEIVKKVWDYIKANKLQDTANKRMINADDKLGKIFGGKKQISMFDLAKVISIHVK